MFKCATNPKYATLAISRERALVKLVADYNHGHGAGKTTEVDLAPDVADGAALALVRAAEVARERVRADRVNWPCAVSPGDSVRASKWSDGLLEVEVKEGDTVARACLTPAAAIELALDLIRLAAEQ